MSASLVGSEMCIRDRLLALLHLDALAPVPADPGAVALLATDTADVEAPAVLVSAEACLRRRLRPLGGWAGASSALRRSRT
eukprot:294222-Alexandrium_andersonii.AAC.1